MAITPSTSVQSFTINKYTASESGGTGNSCPSTLYLEVQHRIISTTSTTTTLQITLILHHAQINLGAGNDDCYIQVGNVSTSWKGPNLYSTTTGQTTTLGTKNIQVTHTNGLFENQNFIIRYRFNATYSGTSVKYITNNYTNSTQNKITLPALYTACTSPTSVSASGYVKPGGSFTVSWSGAAGGTNNSINGYDVYYRVASSATAPGTTSGTYTGKTSISSTATSGSTTITVSSDVVRGHIVVCGVVTKGTAGSSFYSSIKTGGSVTVNRLPGKPTVSANTTIIPYSGSGAVTFTITAGTDNDTGQTKTVRYAKTGDTATTAITSGTSITFSEPTSLTFWTYDGLEFSELTESISITRNTKPQISISASVTTFSALGITRASSDKFLGWSDSITPTVNTNKGGTLTRTIELNRYYNTSSSGKTTSFTVGKQYSSSAVINSGMTPLGVVDPYAAIKNQYGDTLNNDYTFYAWRIKYVLSDGLDSSDPVYYPTNTEQWYAIPTMPTITATYPINGSNPTTTSYLCKNAKFTLYNEGSTNLDFNVTATIGGILVGSSFTTSTSSSNRIFDVELDSAPASNVSVIFKVSYSKSGIIKSRSVTATARTWLESLGAPVMSNDTLKPFSSTSDYYFSTAWPFVGCETIAAAESKYNISNICLTLIRNNITYDVIPSAYERDGDSLRLRFASANNGFYNFTDNWGISTYAGEYKFSPLIKVTNTYEESFLGTVDTTRDFKVNFNEPLTNLQILDFYRIYNTSSTQSLWNSSTMNTTGFAEGNIGWITFSYNGFTRDTCTVKIYFDNEIIRTYTISNSSHFGSSSYTETHDSTSLISGEKFTIPEITKSKTPVKIVVTNNYDSYTCEIEGGMNTVKHTSPIMSLDGLEINENGFLGRLNISDFGIATNKTSSPFQVSNGSTEYSEAFMPLNSESTYTFSDVALLSGVDFDVEALTLKYTSTVDVYSNSSTTLITSEPKYFYLNYITVFKASPTAAYRKNSIGINTSNLKDNAILDIHQAAGKEDIYFKGIYNKGEVQEVVDWDIDVSNGAINYTSGTSKYFLDLKNQYSLGYGFKEWGGFQVGSSFNNSFSSFGSICYDEEEDRYYVASPISGTNNCTLTILDNTFSTITNGTKTITNGANASDMTIDARRHLLIAPGYLGKRIIDINLNDFTSQNIDFSFVPYGRTIKCISYDKRFDRYFAVDEQYMCYIIKYVEDNDDNASNNFVLIGSFEINISDTGYSYIPPATTFKKQGSCCDNGNFLFLTSNTDNNPTKSKAKIVEYNVNNKLDLEVSSCQATIGGANVGNETYYYASFNNIKHYELNDTFTFSPNTNLVLCLDPAIFNGSTARVIFNIAVNNTNIFSETQGSSNFTPIYYNYLLPAKNIEITFARAVQPIGGAPTGLMTINIAFNSSSFLVEPQITSVGEYDFLLGDTEAKSLFFRGQGWNKELIIAGAESTGLPDGTATFTDVSFIKLYPKEFSEKRNSYALQNLNAYAGYDTTPSAGIYLQNIYCDESSKECGNGLSSDEPINDLQKAINVCRFFNGPRLRLLNNTTRSKSYAIRDFSGNIQGWDLSTGQSTKRSINNVSIVSSSRAYVNQITFGALVAMTNSSVTSYSCSFDHSLLPSSIASSHLFGLSVESGSFCTVAGTNTFGGCNPCIRVTDATLKIGGTLSAISGTTNTNMFAATRGVILSNASSFPATNQGTFTNSFTSFPVQLTMTRIENSYVNATYFGYLSAYKTSNTLFLNGNFGTSTSLPSTNGTWTDVGRITGWNGISDVWVAIPGQTVQAHIVLKVTSNGLISITNGSGTATGVGSYRFVLNVPATY